MKTCMCALVLLVCAALVGCADQTDVSLDPPSGMIAGNPTLAKGVSHSATGSVHVAMAWGEPYYDNCTVSAIEHMDGSFSGHVLYFDHGCGCRVRADVVDLKVDNGNRAKVSARIQRIVGFASPFTHIFFVVEDNGEGGAFGPDEASWFILSYEGRPNFPSIAQLTAMSSDDFLSFLESRQLLPTMFTYLNGNVQVR